MKTLCLLFVLAVLAIGTKPAAAQAPGAPVGPGCGADYVFIEGPTDTFADEHHPFALSCPVFQGYVVLVESPDPALRQDPRNWSDVVIFNQQGPAQPGAVSNTGWMMSDTRDPATGVEPGITAADLAPAGLTIADILANPFTVYIPEGLNAAAPDENDYPANGPAGNIIYRIYSDPPEHPTPAGKNSWGQVKGIYR